MGDSRSWAAEMEDETTTCKYGVTSPYFDNCTCEGCEKDYDKEYRIKLIARNISYHIEELLEKTPEHLWKNITSIKVSKIDEDI